MRQYYTVTVYVVELKYKINEHQNALKLTLITEYWVPNVHFIIL